jgi:hypothetical protein
MARTLSLGKINPDTQIDLGSQEARQGLESMSLHFSGALCDFAMIALTGPEGDQIAGAMLGAARRVRENAVESRVTGKVYPVAEPYYRAAQALERMLARPQSAIPATELAAAQGAAHALLDAVTIEAQKLGTVVPTPETFKIQFKTVKTQSQLDELETDVYGLLDVVAAHVNGSNPPLSNMVNELRRSLDYDKQLLSKNQLSTGPFDNFGFRRVELRHAAHRVLDMIKARVIFLDDPKETAGAGQAS